jgi:hypothetical protein
MPKVVTELDIELAKWNAKTAEIKRDMQQLRAEAKKESIGESLIGKVNNLGGAVGVGGIAAGIKQVLSSFDALNDSATKLGETPEVIQRVQRAAELSGTSLDGVANGFIKLEKALGDVENSQAAEILEKYNLSAETLMAMPLDEKVAALADAFKQARDDGTGVYELQVLLGKSSAELIPLMEEGGDAIRAMYAGTSVVANEAVYQMSVLNDQIDNVIGNLKNMAGSALMEAHDALMKFGALVGLAFGQDHLMDYVDDSITNRQRAAIKKADAVTARRETRAQGFGASLGDAAAAKAAKEQEEADKKAAKADEDRAKRIRDLQSDIESKRISLLPNAEQLAEFKAKLQDLFENVDFLDPSMEGLDEAIRLAGDPDEEERLLAKKKEALELESKIKGLEKPDKAKMETIRTAATPGSVTAAINTIFGRSANELVLDETKRQTQVLERIDKGIAKLADNSPGSLSGNDVFEFP